MVESNALLKRARILRDPNVGDGIISINGEQHSFSLEKHWKSDAVPTAGMTVDALFNEAGELVLLQSVEPAVIIQEKAKIAFNVVLTFLKTLFNNSKERYVPKTVAFLNEKSKNVASQIQAKDAPSKEEKNTTEKESTEAQLGVVLGKHASSFVKQVGMTTLLCMGTLYISWFHLDFFSSGKGLFNFKLTLEGILILMNNMDNLTSFARMKNGSAGAGLYGFLAYLAILAPLTPVFIKKRRAWLAYLAPLAYLFLLIVIGISKGSELGSRFGVSGKSFGRMLDSMGSNLDLGFYVSVIAALILTLCGLGKLLSFKKPQ